MKKIKVLLFLVLSFHLFAQEYGWQQVTPSASWT